MNNRIKIFGIIGLAALVAFQGCANKLEVTNPNYLNDDQVRQLLSSSDQAKVEATLSAIGSGLESYLCLSHSTLSGGFSNNYANEYSMNLFRDLGCEDMIYGYRGISTTDGWAAYYNHTFDPAEYTSAASNNGWWFSSSYIIAQANKSATYLTDEVATSPNALPSVKMYAAQAKTLRAYGYLQLMERFRKAYKYGGSEQQGMPIYTEYRYNTPVEPLPAQETWEWIINELETAGQYFAAGSNAKTDGYVVVDPAVTASYWRIDRTMSDYFLARACLDYGDYDKAIAACQRILAKYPNFIDEAHYGVDTKDLDAIATPVNEDWTLGEKDVKNDDNAFLSMTCNPEAMFGWTNDGSLYAYSFLNSIQPGNSTGAIFQISQDLYDKMDDNDFRKARFTDHAIAEFPWFSTSGHAAASLPKYSNLKFGATIHQNAEERSHVTIGSDMVLFRTSEVWLMLAEAQYQAGKENDAKATLNKLLAARTKAGAQPLTCDTYKGNLSTWEQIKLQWRIEMWGENGLNYYCHKRWNEPSIRTGSNHWNDKTWTVDEMEWKIPLKELQTNSYWER
ncbi:MAG: RagB/SusD family nutrient uptake outer membrane protein [Bacteroidales bacterium]|nr:RagB/SusD family nutrient uptake outer membrane protein [Bacteroidales bacterium]